MARDQPKNGLIAQAKVFFFSVFHHESNTFPYFRGGK
jgi:hypothetical protein